MWYNLNNLQLKLMAEHRDRMDHKTVNIFISSSFSDMHAERDYLVEYVFPRLREWCEKRRLYLNDIDLRWGVSLADSTAKNTIRVCLNNIDECRPFFLCFLGQRRGTVFGSDISVETYDEYPELKGMGDVYSATELEIEHALLSPMIRIVEERKERPEKARRALFFLRDDPFKDVDLSALHQKIYTNAGAADPEDAEKKHAAFRALVRESWDKVTSYQCRFDKDRKTPELRGFGEDGTSASPAIAFASNVLPVPGGPTISTPRGILPPKRRNFAGSFRKSTISCISSFASSMPATSFNVSLSFPGTSILARLFPNCNAPLPAPRI